MWFQGGVEAAINHAKSAKAIFTVFIYREYASNE